MDQRCHTFSLGPYDEVPGASCRILYVLVLSLVLFTQSLYLLFNLSNFLFTCIYKYMSVCTSGCNMYMECTAH